MPTYLARRVLHSLVLFVLITMITFAVIRIAPGGPAILANPNLSKSQMHTLRAGLGLDDPLPVQYARWMGHVMQGQLGTSFNESVPVSDLIRERLPNTLLLGAAAFTIAVSFGLAFGVVSAAKRNTWIDRLFSVVGVLNLSVPVFWLAIVLILVFAVELRWLPIGGIPDDPQASWLRYAKHLVLPAIVASGFMMANVMRYTRASMLEVSSQLYVTAARAMGHPEQRVVLKYMLKNAMLPVVTVIGLGIPQLFGGAAITETVFSWPGIGSLGIAAARSGDFPVVMGITLVVSAIVVIANLLTDLSYAWLNPRVNLA
jgi:peptide/nickel transport system permease protein